MEKKKKKKKKKNTIDRFTSKYRVFSRLFTCFVLVCRATHTCEESARTRTALCQICTH